MESEEQKMKIWMAVPRNYFDCGQKVCVVYHHNVAQEYAEQKDDSGKAKFSIAEFEIDDCYVIVVRDSDGRETIYAEANGTVCFHSVERAKEYARKKTLEPNSYYIAIVRDISDSGVPTVEEIVEKPRERNQYEPRKRNTGEILSKEERTMVRMAIVKRYKGFGGDLTEAELGELLNLGQKTISRYVIQIKRALYGDGKSKKKK
jgi:hypothetical protein